MADYLPNVSFHRSGLTRFPKKQSMWFAFKDRIRSLRRRHLTVNENRDAKTVLRDSLRKYIINTPIENTTLGIEILYTDRPDQISPKRIFIVRRVRPEQPEQEFKIVNNTRVTRLRNDAVPPDEPFEQSGTVFRNNQLQDVVKKLRRKNILQISLCEVYHDGDKRTRDGREYKPYTMEVKVLYRNISRELKESVSARDTSDIDVGRQLLVNIHRAVMRQDRVEARRLREELLNYFLTVRSRFAPTDPAQEILEQRISDIREILNDTNPNQLQVVPAPDPVPKIGSASYPDICVICQESVVGEGCRVNCPAAHIYHCECINGWRNSRATDTYFDTDWHDECPMCRQPITQMYHVDIPEGFTTGFGKRIKRKSNKSTKVTNSGMSLKSINSLIKLVQKI